jgi:hypothetical protein
MVELAEIQTIYYMVAATGVLVAAVFYILNLRAQQENMKQTLATRKAQILSDIELFASSLPPNKTFTQVVYQQQFKTYEEWLRKYSAPVDPESYSNLLAAHAQTNYMGGLVYEGITDLDHLLRITPPLWIMLIWERISPVILEWRSIYKDPFMGFYTEYLYNEIRKKYPEVDTSSMWKRVDVNPSFSPPP